MPSRAPVDLLILGAFSPELARLRLLLGDDLRANVGGLAVEARVAGIGLPAAAAGAAGHIAELRPRAVVLLGTCGAYARAGLAIGDVVVARRVHLVDGGALAGHSQFPEPMGIVADADAALSAALAGAAPGVEGVDVATTLAITVDDAAADAIARRARVSVEHLEAHGVAVACAARATPFAALFGVANFVGAGARAEWRVHHRAAEEAAAEHLGRWIEAGAQCCYIAASTTGCIAR